MLRNVFFGLAIAVLLQFTSTNVFAAEPSINDVYQAAEAGKYREADAMMQQVLRSHPDSAKAHFVDAELMAKEGRLSEAKAELATAERLKPGLPFAKPAAVEALKARLAPVHGVQNNVSNAAAPNSGFPWGIFLVIAGVIAIVIIVVRTMSQRQVVQAAPLGNDYGPITPYGASGVGQTGSTGSSMGSTILGGLATGAAVGAGMVAGEALMHRILDDKSSGNAPAQPERTSSDFSSPQYDMGGDDFGVSDASSWDDSSDAGGSDWD